MHLLVLRQLKRKRISKCKHNVFLELTARDETKVRMGEGMERPTHLRTQFREQEIRVSAHKRMMYYMGGGATMTSSNLIGMHFVPRATFRRAVRLFAALLLLVVLEVFMMASAYGSQSGVSSTDSLLQQARAYNQGQGVRLDPHRAASFFGNYILDYRSKCI